MSDTILAITTGRNGYSADQVVDNAITIGELLEQLQEVADAWGEDTKVVIHGYGHGATWEPVRGVEEVEEECPACGFTGGQHDSVCSEVL